MCPRAAQQQQQQQQQQQKQQQNQKRDPRPPLWKIWWVACRPHTLTASLAPVIVAYNVGMASLFHDKNNNNNDDDNNKALYFRLTIQWAWFCMLMQLGTNLHNDYADFVKGADTDMRLGHARATQKGWLTPMQTAMASNLVLWIGLMLGCNFLSNIPITTNNDDENNNNNNGLVTMNTQRWIMLFIVLSSIFNAYAYTGGPWPLGYIGLGDFSIGYSGLGDLFVFLYFGLVATLTLPFLYICYTTSPTKTEAATMMNTILWTEMLPYAIQVAVLATNIIVVNNLRDRHTDVVAKKHTLAVRFGADFCKMEYTLMFVIAYGLVLYDYYHHSTRSLWRLLPLISIPLARKEWHAIYTKDGSALNPHVGGTAKVQFIFCILLAIAVRRS